MIILVRVKLYYSFKYKMSNENYAFLLLLSIIAILIEKIDEHANNEVKRVIN